MATRKIDTELALSGEAEFKAAMKGVNSTLAVTKSEMDLVTAEFGKNNNSMAALTAQSKVLSDQLETEQQKEALTAGQLAKVRAAYEAASASGQANEKQLKKMEEELDLLTRQHNKAAAAVAKTKASIAENTTALEAARKAETQYVPVTQRLVAAKDNAAKKIKEFAAKTKEAAHHVPVLGEALDVASAGFKTFSSVAKGALAVTKATGKLIVGGTVGALVAAGGAAVVAAKGFQQLGKFAVEAAQAKGDDGKPLYAQYAQLGENLEGLTTASGAAKAALGSLLLPALESLSTEGTQFLNDFSAAMAETGGDTEKMGAVVGDFLAKGVQQISEKLPQYLKMGGDIITALGGGIAANLDTILASAGEILQTFTDGLISAAPGIGTAAVDVVMSLVGFLIENAPELLAAGLDLLNNVITGITNALPELIPAAVQMISQLLMALVQNAPQLVASGLELILALVQGLIEALPELIIAAGEAVKALVQGFEEKAEDIVNIGKNAVEKIKEGIAHAWESLKAWFKSIWDSLFGGLSVDVGVSGTPTGGSGGGGKTAAPLRSGLWRVPYDGFPAVLHANEAVLTSSQADKWRTSRGSGGGGGVVVNVYAQTLSEDEVDYLISRVNREFGEAI